jgi:hypothetical protein
MHFPSFDFTSGPDLSRIDGQKSERKTAMESICLLNARGVALLHDGMYRDATVFFRQASECLGARFLMQQSDHDGDGIGDSGNALFHGDEELQLHAVPVHGNITTLEFSFSPGNNFAFFDKAFLANLLLPVNNNSIATFHDETSQFQLTAVFLYNWGLACHYAAMDRGKSKYLHRAMHLYTQAYHVLNHDIDVMVFNSNHKSGSSSMMPLLLLAINNNMGHISAHLADEAAARTSQDNLKCILSGCSECSSDDYSILPTADYEFFICTATILIDPVMARAPAA